MHRDQQLRPWLKTAPLMFLAWLGLATGAIAFTETNNYPRPEWISPAASNTAPVVMFRRAFTNQPGLLKAVLLVAGEGNLTVAFNNTRVIQTEGRAQAAGADVTSLIRPGENELKVLQKKPDGGAQLGVVLELSAPNGRIRWLVSDTDWSVSLDAREWSPVVSHGRTGAKPKEDPFDPSRAFDAYNSWRLARGTNAATPAETLRLPPGFQAELIRSAQPGEDSWIALAFDPQGRLTIAKEKRGLLRFTLGQASVEKVETINDSLLECRGLLYTSNALYAVANNSRALFRLRDTNASGQFNEVTELLATEGGVGHGRNHVKLGPDGKIYLIHGDDVVLTPKALSHCPPNFFAPDQLIPAAWDESVEKQRSRVPFGHLLRAEPDGSDWEMICGGLRNPLDVAFNEDGEAFTYDADNERDIGAPWYRPTRVLHLVSGGDYGWRRSSGTWPVFRPDTLPPAVDIGVGSPTAIEFGTRSAFPPRYQRALFIGDWAYGRILAVQLTPSGASYTGVSGEFVTGRPLNVTDLAFGPDGALYFTTGGRQTQSGLYRVRFLGVQTPEPAKTAKQIAEEVKCGELRLLRRQLEKLHVAPTAAPPLATMEFIWGNLANDDLWIRNAARVALEWQPIAAWQERALRETKTLPALMSLLSLARIGPATLQPRVIERLNAVLPQVTTDPHRLVALRAYTVSLSRHGLPSPALTKTTALKLESMRPTLTYTVNHELMELLIRLDAPRALPRTMQQLGRAKTSEELLRWLYLLREIKTGWTLEQRREFFAALAKAEKMQGAREYYRALENIRAEVTATLSTGERLALRSLIEKQSPAAASAEPAVFVKAWTAEDVAPSLDQVARGRSFTNGRAAYAKSQCVACHRCGPEGGVLGPDLTALASRFGRRDILEHILKPSLAIDDKFRQTTFLLKDGEPVTGTVEIEDAEKILVRPNLLSEQTLTLAPANLRERRPSDLSPMPEGLLNGLTLAEILDLLAYLEAGGNEKHATFKR